MHGYNAVAAIESKATPEGFTSDDEPCANNAKYFSGVDKRLTQSEIVRMCKL